MPHAVPLETIRVFVNPQSMQKHFGHEEYVPFEGLLIQNA